MRAFTPAHGNGPTVWLVAVTHVGTPDYYAQLQGFLDAQPLVLFEGVGAKNNKFRLHEATGYSLQNALAEALHLRFQLDAIDYSRDHFRNSDLTVAQLRRLLEDSQTPPATPAGGASVRPAPGAPAVEEQDDSASAGGSGDLNQLLQIMQGTGLLGGLARLGVSAIAASPRLQAATQIALIEVLGQLPEDLSQMGGLPESMRRLVKVLIEERNKTVVSDVQSALKERPRRPSLAVFYGAGHMLDLEQRLRTALRYEPASEQWHTAIQVDTQASHLSRFELSLTRRLISLQMDALKPVKPESSTTPAHP